MEAFLIVFLLSIPVWVVVLLVVGLWNNSKPGAFEARMEMKRRMRGEPPREL